MLDNDTALLKELYDNKIVEKGHHVLRSGKHSDTYINKTKITLNAKLFTRIVHRLAIQIEIHYKDNDYDLITGPAVAGMSFVSRLTLILNKPFVFTEKVPVANVVNMMQFRSEYQKILKGKRVIIIEDVITTGGSIIKTAQAICRYGGIPVAVFCIWNRNPEINFIKLDYPIHLYSLINEKVIDWEPEVCPMCRIVEEIYNDKC